MFNFVNGVDQLDICYHVAVSRRLKKDYWMVKNGFTYHLDKDECKSVTVPSFFLTDGASVPRVFWSIIPPWGIYGQAAVVHDLLCETLQIMHNDEPMSITRQHADSVFVDALRSLQLPKHLIISIDKALWIHRTTNKKAHKPNVSEEKKRCQEEVYELMKQNYQNTLSCNNNLNNGLVL